MFGTFLFIKLFIDELFQFRTETSIVVGSVEKQQDSIAFVCYNGSWLWLNEANFKKFLLFLSYKSNVCILDEHNTFNTVPTFKKRRELLTSIKNTSFILCSYMQNHEGHLFEEVKNNFEQIISENKDEVLFGCILFKKEKELVTGSKPWLGLEISSIAPESNIIIVDDDEKNGLPLFLQCKKKPQQKKNPTLVKTPKGTIEHNTLYCEGNLFFYYFRLIDLLKSTLSKEEKALLSKINKDSHSKKKNPHSAEETAPLSAEEEVLLSSAKDKLKIPEDSLRTELVSAFSFLSQKKS